MGKITRSEAIALIKKDMEKRGIIIPIGVSELSEDLVIKEFWDCVDYVEMIYGVENEFAFTAEDQEWGQVVTLGDFADVIVKYV